MYAYLYRYTISIFQSLQSLRLREKIVVQF
nr:MAG TPA: hypothetical protein [Crassvirales sp.]